jgi:hypothetical protein
LRLSSPFDVELLVLVRVAWVTKETAREGLPGWCIAGAGLEGSHLGWPSLGWLGNTPGGGAHSGVTRSRTAAGYFELRRDPW